MLNNIKCSICLEEINDLCKTSCNHSFCYECLNEWLSQNKNTCPMCRSKLERYIFKDSITRIITINSPNSNNVVDIDPLHSELIRDLLIKNGRLKCLFYLISIGFTYTISKILTIGHENLSLINEINSCKYNLTQLENEYFTDGNNYNSVLVYDNNINKMSHCMISDYYYNKCFS